MQPFNSNADANYLRVLNDLARIDRHRRHNVSTTYLADLQPVVEVPDGTTTVVEWGERVLIEGYAQAARITISPWSDDTKVSVNPRVGIDPDVTEWTQSTFWLGIPFTDRLPLVQGFLAAEVATYEYDCTGTSRKQDLLTEGYRAECDLRVPKRTLSRPARAPVAWGPPLNGTRSTREKFFGEDLPTGPTAI